MDFPTYLDQAWSDHATQPQQVADGFATGASLISSADQIPQLAALITHVMGEHLGQWDSGEVLLNSLRSNAYFTAGSDGEKAIHRSAAALRLAGGDNETIKTFSQSDQIRICAVASAALSDKNIERALDLFSSAMTQAEPGLPKNDPALRTLAVTGNNLACALEEKGSRTPGETKLMIAAAHAGRKYWELAGGWNEVQMAEYRLSMTYIASGDGERANQHAKNCLTVGTTHAAGPLDMFYAHEAMALSERARGNFSGFKLAAEKAKTTYDSMSAEDQKGFAGAMKKLALN